RRHLHPRRHESTHDRDQADGFFLRSACRCGKEGSPWLAGGGLSHTSITSVGWSPTQTSSPCCSLSSSSYTLQRRSISARSASWPCPFRLPSSNSASSRLLIPKSLSTTLSPFRSRVCRPLKTSNAAAILTASSIP